MNRSPEFPGKQSPVPSLESDHEKQQPAACKPNDRSQQNPARPAPLVRGQPPGLVRSVFLVLIRHSERWSFVVSAWTNWTVVNVANFFSTILKLIVYERATKNSLKPQETPLRFHESKLKAHLSEA